MSAIKSTLQHSLHLYSKLTNGPIAAASGALYADVRAYCSHIKNVKRTRLLSSLPRLVFFFFFFFFLASINVPSVK